MVVVGAGVVGLAAAAELARSGRSVVVLERHAGPARETTSRNSEVIHAGIYYPPGSHKARFCVEGRERLYARCAAQRIPHRRCGKWIVATDAAERDALEELLRRGRENGAPGLRVLEARELRLIPHVRGLAALDSPATGVVDSHALCLSLQAEAERYGATLAFRHELVAFESPRFSLRVRDPAGGAIAVSCAAVVNAAGLAADRVAAWAGMDTAALGYRLHWCKGDYFSVSPAAPLHLSKLIYPVPGQAGLGIHTTFDLAGRLRLGPDAEYVTALDYGVDPGKAERFAAAARRYLPNLEAAWLAPDYAGIRPKLAAPGEGFRDFAIREESARGLPGFVNLIGIESPGLTAALAIARHVGVLLASL